MNDLSVSDLAALHSQDQAAYAAAHAAAVAAGALEPQGMMERMAAGVMASNGQWFRNTAVAQGRLAAMIPQAAYAGAAAYLAGQRGNAYTHYLAGRFGVRRAAPAPQTGGAASSGKAGLVFVAIVVGFLILWALGSLIEWLPK